MKVLHVLRQLETGGIECWLDRLVANWPKTEETEFHFALEEEDPGALAPRLIAHGARIHTLSHPIQMLRYSWRFLTLLRREGPFTAVHCHNHKAAFFPLFLAALAGVPIRVSHAHADFRSRSVSTTRRAYERLCSFLVCQLSTVRLAVSNGAAKDLFQDFSKSFEWLPCGIDLASYLDTIPRRDSSCFTLIHVGRLVPEKNHEFLLHLFAHLSSILPESRLWIVGEGPEGEKLQRLSHRLGIDGKTSFLGQREDVPQLLQAADLFVFPSRSEGLGISAIEAQLCGLPVLIAAHLPEELNAVPGLCHRLAIDLPIEEWVQMILQIRESVIQPNEESSAALASSPYSLHCNIQRLKGIYAR